MRKLLHHLLLVNPVLRSSRSQGVTFPHPQRAKRLTSSASSSCGVVLLGDSAHAFPPDIGQGVNSALVDVLELESELEGEATDLASALGTYERKRMPEVKALVKLCQVANPYQYRQTGVMAGLRQKVRVDEERNDESIISEPEDFDAVKPCL